MFFFLKFEFDKLLIKKFAMKEGYIFIYNSVEKIKEKLVIKLLTKIIDLILKNEIQMKNIFIYYLIIIIIELISFLSRLFVVK